MDEKELGLVYTAPGGIWEELTGETDWSGLLEDIPGDLASKSSASVAILAIENRKGKSIS